MVKAQQPRWHKQNGSSCLELFSSFILKMQISMAVKGEMGSEVLSGSGEGVVQVTVVPFQHIALGKLPREDFSVLMKRGADLACPTSCSQCVCLSDAWPACFIHVFWGSAAFQVCQQTGFAKLFHFPPLDLQQSLWVALCLIFILISPN